MKKVFSCLLLTFVLMLLSTGICQAASENPILMHTNLQFEDQKIGDEPYGFEWFEYSSNVELKEAQVAVSLASAEVVSAPTDDNPDNKAMQLTGCIDPSGNEYTGKARSTFFHLPIQEKGVISFSFKVNDLNGEKNCRINTNSTARQVRYLENASYINFITIKDNKAYFNDSTLISPNIEAGKWYEVDLVFNIPKLKATLYFDGKAINTSLPPYTYCPQLAKSSALKTVTEVRFDAPATKGSSWCIDNLRIYEADEVISDAEVDATWNEFTKSPFFIGPEYEAGKAADYSYLAYLASYQKQYTVLGVKKLFINGEIKPLAVPFQKLDGRLMAPIRAVAENSGATVGWDDETQKISISYKGHVMEVSPNENIYYIDKAPLKLTIPVKLVDGTACMDIDIFFNFLGKTYTEDESILWIDEPMTFEWSLPPEVASPWRFGTLKKAVQTRLKNELFFDWPTTAELAEIMKARPRQEGIPRLMSISFDEIKENAAKDPLYEKVVKGILDTAKADLALAPMEHAYRDGKRADFTAGAMAMTNWAFAYHVSDESEEERQKYKDAIWKQMEAYDTFPDLGMWSHALSTTQMCFGFYAAYDWLYDEWTPEQRKLMENIFRRNIFDKMLGYNTSIIYHEGNIIMLDGNQSIINSGGLSLLALAMFEEDPEYFGRIICGAMYGAENGFAGLFPNGEWSEGISYWRYAMGFLPRVVQGFQSACGTDFGIMELPGTIQTAKFPMRMMGATTAYAYGDANPETGTNGVQMFIANVTGDKELAAYRKENMGSGSFDDIVNWVFDTDPNNANPGKDELDAHCVTNSTIIMRTGWDKSDTTVAFHGGANNDAHGHRDVSSVQFDMSGVRFGMDLPREDYNLRDDGYYNTALVKDFYPNGKIFSGGHFYRQKGEGHNLVVANRSETNTKAPSDPTSYDVKPTGKGEFIKTDFGDTSSFAIMDMTDTNDIFERGLRGVRLDKIQQIIEIQDDIRAERPTDFLWSMHTIADIEISEDGKSAILTQNGAQVKATIINDTDMKFEVLPAEFDDDYGTSLKPLYETPNTTYEENKEYFDTHGRTPDCKGTVRKLAVKNPSTDHFKLSVTFQPYIGENTPRSEYVALAKWKNVNSSRVNLDSVTVDGKPLEGFNKDNYNYTIRVVTEKSDVPVVAVESNNPGIDVTLLPATTVPGTTVAVLKRGEQVVGLYTFGISPINNTTLFHSDKQVPIYNYYFDNEPQSDNPASALFDANFATKYATNGQGDSVTMDLGSVITGNLKLNIAALNGTTRKEFFKIEYSDDGMTYHTAFDGSNSGTTTGFETFDVAKSARYIRIKFYGSSKGAWVSITELFISNE